jgi:hypothetical protein
MTANTTDATDDESSDTTDRCCDDPDVHTLPVRAQKIPGRRHRETYDECLNCGASGREL